jgi:hypothetical protein
MNKPMPCRQPQHNARGTFRIATDYSLQFEQLRKSTTPISSMKRIKFTLAATLFAVATLHARAATLYFDFGDSSTQTTSGANAYNNIYVGGSSLLTIANCVDSTGANTGVGISASGFQPGSNANGTQSPTGAAAAFAAAATRDNMFGNSVTFNGGIYPLGTVTLAGLDTSGNTHYYFTFFGSRTGVSDNRETLYAVSGANSNSVALNTANNTSNVGLVNDITPDGSGTITIYVSKGPNNNNASSFFYLGAMSMLASNTASPVITGQPASQTVSPGATANFTVTATSATAKTYQWQLNGTNVVDGGSVSGATNQTLTITGASAADVGHYRVLVSNNAGTIPSSFAALALQASGYFPTPQVTGKLGDQYRAEYCDDLSAPSWSLLSTKTLAAAPQLYTDFTTPSPSMRFYQAHLNGNIGSANYPAQLGNGDFEGGWLPDRYHTTNWVLFGSAALEGWAALNGTNGLALEPWWGTSAGAYQDIAAIPGATYTLSAMFWCDVASPASHYIMNLEFYDDAKVYIGKNDTNFSAELNGGWQQLSIVGTPAPTNAAYVRPVLYGGSLVSGETLKIDDVTFTYDQPAGAPVITNGLPYLTVSPGATATFSVGVSDPAGVAYQWMLNGTSLVDGGNISGATSATLIITGVSAADVGHYRAVASNGSGFSTSGSGSLAIADLSMYPGIIITGQTGDIYRVDYAPVSSPTSWTALSTNTLTSSPQTVIDTTSPNANTRVYRAVYAP